MFCMDLSMVFVYFWYRKYRYMVWKPLFCVWVGFGNSLTLFLVRVELRRALRLLYMYFGKGLVAI